MLIDLAVLVILAALIWWLLQQLPLPAPLAQVVQIVFVVLCVIALIGILQGGGGFSGRLLR